MSNNKIASSSSSSSDALLELLAPDGYYTYLGITKSPVSYSSTNDTKESTTTTTTNNNNNTNEPPLLHKQESVIDEDLIKKNYRKLSLRHHPDKPGGDTDTFRLLNRAQKVLLNKKLRQQYDILGIDLDDEDDHYHHLHRDDDHHRHPDDVKNNLGGGGDDDQPSTAQGIVHEIASSILTCIIQVGVRTLMLGAVSTIIVRFWWTLYPAICFMGYVGFRIIQTAKIPSSGGSLYYLVSPTMIVTGLLLMHHGRNIITNLDDNNSSNNTSEWTKQFWIGEAIVIGIFTYNSLSWLPKNALILGILSIFSLITALFFRGRIWNYIIVLGLIALIGVLVALAFPVMELVLEAILNEKLKLVGEKVRHHHQILKEHYDRKLQQQNSK